MSLFGRSKRKPKTLEEMESVRSVHSAANKVFHVMMKRYDPEEIGLTWQEMWMNAKMMGIVSQFVHGKLTPEELDTANDFLGDVLAGSALGFAIDIPEGEHISTLVRALEHLEETKGKLTMEEKVRFAFCIFHSRIVRVCDPEKEEVCTGLVDFDTVEHIEQCYQESREMFPEWYAFADEEPPEPDEDEAPFGFSAENPVPVVSVSDAYAYLNCLKKPGYEVFYQRVASCQGPHGIMDDYLVTAQPENDPDADPELFHIYIDPYARENSFRAPEGFVLDLG